ncbi:hypothetical protein [Rubellicoccus peritrichatus]|uniref:Uncharacterized protein n=1 Tax=Rubellicoccus peritrichatus TaxID=3080537 RepID=A0AAQ3L6Y8_9BACT|nr:hypothetical protein [Puniceicoccus sp. CR14]WOO40146.1 hypothetical protein RZN69_16110 [Puniceicoccus sp. CR14]
MDPIESANDAFAAGEFFFYEIAMLPKKDKEGRLLPVEWKIAERSKINESVLIEYPNRERLDLTDNIMIELEAAQLRKKGLYFAGRFNLQMAKRLQDES